MGAAKRKPTKARPKRTTTKSTKTKAKTKPTTKPETKPTKARKAKPKEERAKQGPPALGRFASDPGFAVVGDGNWMPPGDAFVLYVVLREPLEDDHERAAFLRNVPRLCRHALAWSGSMLRLGSYVEQSYYDERKAATLVRKHYGKAAKPVKLSRAEKRELATDDFDPKVLPAVEEYFADYGNEAPWARFYEDLHRWLVEAHARYPIRLVLRPALDGKLSPLHVKSMESLLALDLAAIAANPAPWVGDFLGQVVVHAARFPLDEARAHMLAPWADRAPDHVAEEVRLALSDDEFATLDPYVAIRTLIVNHDRFAAHGARFAPRIEKTFARLWAAHPEPAVVDRVAWTIRNSLPFARKTPVLEVLLAEVARHREGYARVLADLVPQMLDYDRATATRLDDALRS
jgi:hypothetical protein